MILRPPVAAGTAAHVRLLANRMPPCAAYPGVGSINLRWGLTTSLTGGVV